MEMFANCFAFYDDLVMNRRWQRCTGQDFGPRMSPLIKKRIGNLAIVLLKSVFVLSGRR